MRVEGVLLSRGFALALAIALAACDSAPPTPTSESAFYRPATLDEAVLLGDQIAVENFLALGADPNEAEADGTTPLMRAVHGEFHDIAQLLLDAGAAPSTANFYGVTALYIAARAGDAAATRTLLAAGADANSALPSGETALMTAAKAGNAATVYVLLTGGAEDLSLAELVQARSRAQVAEASGYGALTNPTETRNYADVSARERWYRRTALMLAAAAGHTAVVQLLIDAGSELGAQDDLGATALSLARENGNLDVARILVQAGAASGG